MRSTPPRWPQHPRDRRGAQVGPDELLEALDELAALERRRARATLEILDEQLALTTREDLEDPDRRAFVDLLLDSRLSVARREPEEVKE